MRLQDLDPVFQFSACVLATRLPSMGILHDLLEVRGFNDPDLELTASQHWRPRLCSHAARWQRPRLGCILCIPLRRSSEGPKVCLASEEWEGSPWSLESCQRLPLLYDQVAIVSRDVQRVELATLALASVLWWMHDAWSYEIPAVHERPSPLPVEAGRYLQISPRKLQA